MNINKYPEIQPKTSFIKKMYLLIFMIITGRGIEAAAKVDKEVKEIFEKLPDGFTFYLGVSPAGPNMVVGKDKDGTVKYLGWKLYGKKINLAMKIRNIEAGMKVFTFKESTATAYHFDRFFVEGDLPQALSIVRILDIVEVYLLPKIIAKLAVKRYPKWSEMSPLRKHIGRIRIYIKALISPQLVKVILQNL